MGRSFVYNSGSIEDSYEEDGLYLNFGVFIDGTLNNMYNTDLRTKYGRGGNSKNEISNAKIEKNEDEAYSKVENKKEIEKLLAIENRTKEEQATLERFPEKDVYLVASHRSLKDKMGIDNSYSNDYSNVARMWTCCTDEYRIYIEGMGSRKLNHDDDDGFQFGAGKISGIRARVRKACEEVAIKVSEQNEKKDNSGKKLKELTLDVFGFSRGAASARNFVSEINYKKGVYPAVKVGEYRDEKPQKDQSRENQKVKDNIPQQHRNIDSDLAVFRTNTIKNEPIEKKEMKMLYQDRDGQDVNPNYIIKGNIPQYGHLGICLLEKGVVQTPEELKEIRLIVRFLGIYDTVSSYEEIGAMGGDNVTQKGIVHLADSYFTDDEAQLNLQNMGNLQQIVHFTAKDEHRENFALTRVDQQYSFEKFDGTNRLIERNLPGVHCDIGGAYLNETEIIDEIETTAFLSAKTANSAKDELVQLRQKLIDQYWFKEEQIKITKPFWYYPVKVRELFCKMNGNFLKAYLAKQMAYEALTSERNVRKEYSYIPLHFMAEYFEPLVTKKYMPDSVLDNYSISGNSILEQAKAYLKKHVLEDNKEWDFISDEELKILKANKEIDQEIKNGQLKEKQDQAQHDNLDPNVYKPKVRLELEKIPGMADETVKDWEGLNAQTILRTLRNEYFHWSSNRDWFGMDHATNRIRVEYPKKK